VHIDRAPVGRDLCLATREQVRKAKKRGAAVRGIEAVQSRFKLGSA
jgi:hypothetical protein